MPHVLPIGAPLLATSSVVAMIAIANMESETLSVMMAKIHLVQKRRFAEGWRKVGGRLQLRKQEIEETDPLEAFAPSKP